MVTLTATAPAGAGQCLPCGAVWTGDRTSHCPLCHATFGGHVLGDAHRIGDYLDGSRRCRERRELAELGCWATPNRFGATVWHGQTNTAGVQKRWVDR